MYVATATGCSQVWSTSFPSFPYTTNHKGQGPAVGGSLFENNAEYGMGIWLSVEQQREKLAKHVEELAEKTDDAKIKETAAAWLASYNDKSSRETGEALKNAILESGLLSENADLVAANVPGDNVKALAEAVRENFDHLTKKSVWFFGGDGRADDIGDGGLDQV